MNFCTSFLPPGEWEGGLFKALVFWYPAGQGPDRDQVAGFWLCWCFWKFVYLQRTRDKEEGVLCQTEWPQQLNFCSQACLYTFTVENVCSMHPCFPPLWLQKQVCMIFQRQSLLPPKLSSTKMISFSGWNNQLQHQHHQLHQLHHQHCDNHHQLQRQHGVWALILLPWSDY